jgi:hypothetical protein
MKETTDEEISVHPSIRCSHCRKISVEAQRPYRKKSDKLMSMDKNANRSSISQAESLANLWLQERLLTQ